jgi:hypothetical protein
MALSLWLGCYVITRSPRSRLAWQASLTLWSLAGIFFDILVTINPSPATTWWLGWPIYLPLAIWYHLSLELAPPDRARRQRPFLYGAYVAALALDLIIGFTPWVVADARQGLGVMIKTFVPGPLFPLLPVGFIGLSLLMLFNFWQARLSVGNLALRKQLDILILSSALGVIAIGYGVVAAVLHLSAPTLPIVIALGFGVALLGYGTIRYSALAEGRILRYDFVFSGLLIAVVAAIYFVALTIFEVPFIIHVFAVALVVVTHAGHDFARRVLDRLFLRRRERVLRAALHSVAVEVGEREAVDEGLRSALAAVVTTVEARWG